MRIIEQNGVQRIYNGPLHIGNLHLTGGILPYEVFWNDFDGRRKSERVASEYEAFAAINGSLPSLAERLGWN